MKTILKIGGMSCSACSSHIEKYLLKQDGIIDASVNLVMQEASITYDSSLTIQDLERFIKESGYESLGVYDGKEKKISVKPYFFFGAYLLVYMILSMFFFFPYKNWCLFFGTIPLIIFGFPILKSGFLKLIHFHPNMDSLVFLGSTASFGYSIYLMLNHSNHTYFDSTIMLLYFVKLGRFIDQKSKQKTKEAIQDLVQITPENALLKNGKVVSIDEVKKGDILLVKPGMKIAVDGIIKKGFSHLEEAFLTGESIPVKKQKGDFVIAGSINLDGVLEYEATKIGKDSTISEIVRLVMEATNKKTPIQRMTDQVSGYFIPGVILISILTFFIHLYLGNEALLPAITVLVVSCPCALGLAIPLAVVVSEGVCAKKGILVKSSEVFEKANQITTVVFDKTGTLTYGNLRVHKIKASIPEKEVLELVCSLEQASSHPIAKAFIEEAKRRKLLLKSVSNTTEISGKGITGVIQKKLYAVGNSKLLSKENPYKKEEELFTKDGYSVVYLSNENEVLAIISVGDQIRKEANKVLASIKKEIILLSGDHENVADQVGKQLKISHIISNVLPKEKNAIIKKLQKEGKKVMMVGDGVNDAPSLTTSDIGVSFVEATDIAANSSEVLLARNDLNLLLDFMDISKKTVRIMKQNLFWAFFYNFIMIFIATGFTSITLHPMLASLSMTFSSFSVIMNTLRLRRIK